jgi:F-type H+-transporting ATPase subunit gamma
MTERLADITARISGISQLGAVVNAMRGIAAARVQQSRAQLTAVDSHAAIIAQAIGQALSLLPDTPPAAPAASGRLALVLFCAEQGFAGAFTEHVLNGVRADLANADIFLAGTRGAAIAAERGIHPAWSAALPSQSIGIPKLADQMAEAIYARAGPQRIGRLDVVFSRPHTGQGVERWHLLPFDPARFPQPTGTRTPLLNLPPSDLLDELVAAYVHAQLCQAALHAFAAENQARMEAMAAAHAQIDQRLAALQARQRMIRQDEITEEIIELAAGETASHADQP